MHARLLAVISSGTALFATQQTVPVPVPDQPPPPARRILDSPRPSVHGEFGYAVVPLDFDGDGERDLAVSAPNEGAVYVFRGPELESWQRFQPRQVVPEDAFGLSLAAGPVDSVPGDDLLVGFPGARVGELEAAGRLWLISTREDVRSPISIRQEGPEANTRLGNSVAIGDLDGDGKNDLVAGGPKAILEGEPSGMVYVHSVATGKAWRIDNPLGGWKHGNFGHLVAVADGNGDGKDDLFVSALGNRNQAGIAAAGQCYVFFGPLAEDGKFPPEKRVLVEDPTAHERDGARFGMSMYVDDLNGDGCADFLIGAPRKDNGEAKDAGVGFLFLGPEFAAKDYRRFLRPDPKPHDILGYNSLIADVVGDAKPDVIIASLARDNTIGLLVWDGGDPAKEPILFPRPEDAGPHYVRALARGWEGEGGRRVLLLGDSDFGPEGQLKIGRVVIEGH